MDESLSKNRNFRLGVYNGILIAVSDAFLNSGLVLAPFLSKLGASPVLIGLIPALRVGGWLLPQLLVASRLAHKPYKLSSYRNMSIVRAIAFALMTTATFFLSDQGWLIIITIFMLAIVAFASGVSSVAFTDVTSKIVPHSRLGSFWVLRNVIGGCLALGAGLTLRWLLSHVGFPQNFAIIFLLGTLFATAAYWAFCIVDEPAGRTSSKQSFGKMLRRIPQVIREDSSFRRYMRVRFLALLALLADPFYAVYALQKLSAPESVIGVLVILTTITSIVTNFSFRRQANQGNNVTIFQVGIAFLLLAPLCAILMPTWQSYLLTFIFSTAGQASLGIAAWNLLHALAPEEDRALYIGASNSLLALPSFAPILAGLFVSFAGFKSTFILALMSAAVALAFAFRFQDLRLLDRKALERK
jgi:MFS family permease